MRPQYIIVHHSLTKDGLLEDWEAIRRYHREVNGWADVGYHFGLERVGGELVAKTGQPFSEEGAHCKELHMNSRSLGICVVGNFDLAPPDMATVHFLRDFLWALIVNHGIPVNAVLGHREVGAMAGFDWTKGQYKSCPGGRFPMETLRAMLAGKIGA